MHITGNTLTRIKQGIGALVALDLFVALLVTGSLPSQVMDTSGLAQVPPTWEKAAEALAGDGSGMAYALLGQAEVLESKSGSMTIISNRPAVEPDMNITLALALVPPETVGALPGAFILDVPYLSQNGAWTNGCESVAVVMALQYAGVDISIEHFVDAYLPKGNLPHVGETGATVTANPWKAFPGDPRSEDAWYIFAPPLAEAMQPLASNAHYVQGLGLDELCSRYVAEGYPVAVWVTVDMRAPYAAWILHDEEDLATEVVLINNEHCMLLVGYDDAAYYFNDPLRSKCYRFEREQVQYPYGLMGSQAIVIAPY